LTDRPLHTDLLDAALSAPDRIAAMSVDGATGELRGEVTYGELASAAERVAAGLAALGVRAGDTVAVMMPNRWEFSALVFGISQLGGVYTGIPIAAGVGQVNHILRKTRAKVLVVPAGGRNDPLAIASAMLAGAPDLGHVVVLDGEDEDVRGLVPFVRMLEAEPFSPRLVDDEALAHLGFTSGTTGPPKAVMNTHKTLAEVCWRWVRHVGGPAVFGNPAVDLVASPVGHHTGFLWGALLSAHLGGTALYLDRWVPAIAAEVIARHGVTTMFGAPTFLHDLVRVDGLDAEAAATLRMVAVAGAPIPRQLIPDARRKLDAFICPAWGMTEYGIAISAHPGMQTAEIDSTDGIPVEGCEVRIAVDGEIMAQGTAGSLEIRGPGLFRGYFEDATATSDAIDADGWFATGDIAQVDDDGTIALIGRTKDIVIRGGENIPVGEIETILFRHPDIIEAAVVGVPDDRLGERACAVVVCEPGRSVDLDDVVRFCVSEGLSKHHLPELLQLREDLPKTMSGKVRKVELREALAGEGAIGDR
jgi:cyclohexanecarboxylate-CoA ligase